MSTQILAIDRIREKGFKALTRELGTAGMVQFIQQFQGGRGDYTKERHKTIGHLTMEQLAAEFRHRRVKA
ncbi:MAG: hypothetical protein WCI20_04385 [bacterium]